MKKIYFLWLLLMVFVLVVIQCNNQRSRKKMAIASKHSLIDSFNALTREQQVKTCGSCHTEEYKSEMKGPHASSYINLQKHFRKVLQGDFHCPEYENYIKNVSHEKLSQTNSALLCVTCHALPNMYETMLREPNRNPDSLQVYLEELHIPTMARSGAMLNLITGDDCLTCHYDGQRVVTNNGYKPSGNTNCPQYCSPQPSALFSSNVSCAPCHAEEVKTLVKLPGVAKPETNCLKCHQQYNEKGKGTHYIYWQYDGVDKPRPKHLILFDDISARYEARGKRVIVEWKNTKVPHPLGRCTETIANLQVADAKGKVYGSGEIRFNRRTEHSHVLETYWSPKPVAGKNGFAMPLHGTALFDTIGLVQTANPPLLLHITGVHKEQYWLPDSIGLINYHRTIKL